jgi:hypothetical protein
MPSLGLALGLPFARPVGGFVGPLDFITNTRLGAWSVGYRLFSDFTGSPFRLRIDTTGQPEFDTGFTGAGVSDSADVDAEIGANDAYYAKVYDQSGSSQDFRQTSASVQPAYSSSWASGPFARSMDFAGAQGLISAAALPSAATWWGYIVSIPTGGVSTELWALESYPDAVPYKLIERVFGGKPLYYNNNGGSSAQITYTDGTAYSHLAKGASNLRYLKSSAGGIINDTSDNSLTGSLSTIGFRNDASAYFTGSIQEWALFQGSIDSTKEAALWADLNTRWGTPIP